MCDVCCVQYLRAQRRGQASDIILLYEYDM